MSISLHACILFPCCGVYVFLCATLQLDQSHNFTGAINGFSAGSTIDLSDVAYQAGEYAVWTQGTGAQQGGGTLTVYDASGHAKSSLHLNGVYTPYEIRGGERRCLGHARH